MGKPVAPSEGPSTTPDATVQHALPLEWQLLQGIAEAAIDGILVVAADGRILYQNRRFIEMWGIPEEVAQRRRDEDAVAAVRDKLHDPEQFIERVRYLYEHPYERSRDEIRMRDGRVLDRYSAPLLDGDGVARARVWYFRDVSQIRTEQEEAEVLATAGELFGSSLDVEETLGQIAQLVVPRMADWAAVDVLDEAGRFRRVGVAHVQPGGEELLRELDRRYPLRPREGHLRGRVVTTRKPVALFDVSARDLKRVARDEGHRELLAKLGVRSALWVPLVARNRVLGVISAGVRDERRPFGPADLQLLSELARRAALAVDNALLYRAIERAERRQAAVASLGQRALLGGQLKDVLDEAVELVSRTLDVPMAKVLELLPAGKSLRLIAGVGWRPGLVGQTTVGAGPASQAGYTLAQDAPVVVEDLPADGRFKGPRLLLEHDVVSGLSVIIPGRPKPYGVLGAHTNVRRTFGEDDINFVQAVANVLAATIERHSTEERLTRLASSERSRAAELKAVIEGIGDAVIVLDAAGSVALANPAAEELLDRRLRLGLRGIMRSFEWPREAAARPALNRRLEGVEVRLAVGAAREPTERWLEVSSYPVVVGEEAGTGEVGTILVLRDITAARNARAMREAFLGILSHELRTPVTTIYGGSEVLARVGTAVEDDVRRGVYEDIRAEANRLYRLVENLLVLSRVERQGLHVESEPILLQRLLPRVVSDEGARWPRIQLELDMPAGLPPVAGEEIYLEQVVRNLLTNAAKYGGDGQVTVSALAAENGVSVMVSDRGAGIDSAEAGRLFDIFYRSPEAARRASGAGIGLFVSRQLIQAMGGRIWASNRAGGGAEFGFEVPVFGE